MDEPLIVSKGRYELSIMALFKEKGIEPIFKYEFNHPDTALNFIRQGCTIGRQGMIFRHHYGEFIPVNGDAIHTVDRKRNETGINTSVLQRINNSRTVLFIGDNFYIWMMAFKIANDAG